MAWPIWRTIASLVTSGVMFGLPSRSPPIQEPNFNTESLGEIFMPSLDISREKSSRTSGIVSRNRSSR